ncbi:glycosyltransferase family 2 protein [Ostreiculturibacter nitratireducens]|uniref:glycosyltransferase family 2 protein n=1 Tax=Ostreiculturibacter nitratireducens TaxID=3075226 RepID=UPI0031B6196D
MTAPLPVSVIVASRGRPDALALCLRALRQQDHPRFEVIVVADPAGIAVTEATPVKRVRFDEANISVARNLGIAAAAGEVVAFIDDDAVAEPTWLTRLTAPFADPEVAASGGFVRGRNGISYQWKARLADRWGEHEPLAVDEAKPSLHAGEPGRAVRTEGTNCAFRRDVLAEIGGFDPAYRFYLDDTDLDMRLAAAGHLTAIVPGAQVVHGFAASERRRSDRVPLTLHEIGASSAVFWRRHAAGLDTTTTMRRLRDEQRGRALRHMVSGGIEPDEVGKLMATLEAGLAEGGRRVLTRLEPIPAGTEPFLPFRARAGQARVLAGRIWQARRLRAAAAAAAARGEIVTLILLSPDARPHRVRFRPEGFWEQAGGIFGPADRREPRFRLWTFSARVRHEAIRTAVCRPFHQIG